MDIFTKARKAAKTAGSIAARIAFDRRIMRRGLLRPVSEWHMVVSEVRGVPHTFWKLTQ